MRQLQKVLWSKGVLLSQQHLQAQDGYLDDLLTFKLGAMSVAPSGFRRLVVDAEALAGGSLSIVDAAGLFPDGLAFDVPAADPQPAPKPLASHWRPDQTHMAVYLAVPGSRAGAQNVSLSAEVRHTRYVAESETRRDENTGLSEKPLQLARRNLRLIAEGEPLEGHSALQVARVLRGAGGELTLDPDFVPQLLDFSASPRLMALARRLVEILSAKSTALGATRRQRNRTLADFGPADTASFWLLYTVNTHLPVLRHLFEVQRGHPEALYRALLDLAGPLTTFSTEVHPRDLPAYEHADLGGCFGRLDALVLRLLETVVPAGHLVLPLQEIRPQVYATALDDERIFASPQLFLGVHAAVAADELARRVPQLLKVSAASEIDGLIRQALPGVRLRHVHSLPAALPAKPDHQYFQLDRASPEWNALRTSRNLAVYIPDIPTPRLELIVALPRRED